MSVRRFVKFIFVFLLIAIVLQAAHLFYLSFHLKSRLGAIRAQGHPTTGQELDAWYAHPVGDNAAEVYAQAFERYVEDRGLELRLPIFGVDWPQGPWPQEMIQSTQSYLTRNHDAIQLLYEAGKIQGCRYPVDLSLGIDVLLPHLGSLRQGAKLLALQAVLAAQRGDAQQATQAIHAILNLSRSLENEPVLISRMVAISNNAIAVQATEQVILRVALQDQQLDGLVRALERSNQDVLFTRAMIGERCAGMIAYQDVGVFAMNDPHPLGVAIITTGWKLSGVWHRDMNAYLDAMSYLIDKSQDVFDASPETIDQTAKGMAFPYGLSAILMPALGASYGTQQSMRTVVQTTVVGLAVKRYRLAHGRWPDRFSDLVPQYLPHVPIDPFDNQPLRYEKRDAGFVVYSVGLDGTDNGGRIENEEGLEFKEGTDIVFEYAD